MQQRRGTRRGDVTNVTDVDTVTDESLRPILDELALGRRDRVAVLVNGLGATTYLELYILNRRVAEILGEARVIVHATWVGEYATSLELAGASITLINLDKDLAALLNRPCRTPALTVGAAAEAGPGKTRESRLKATVEEAEIDSDSLATDGPVGPAAFRTMMLAVAYVIAQNRDLLSELDGIIGDATMA